MVVGLNNHFNHNYFFVTEFIEFNENISGKLNCGQYKYTSYTEMAKIKLQKNIDFSDK